MRSGGEALRTESELTLQQHRNRFCNSALADWKASLTPETLKPEVEKVQPVMVVYFEGEIHRWAPSRLLCATVPESSVQA